MFKPVLTLATLLGLGTLTLVGAGATPSPDGFSCGVASERQQGLLRVEEMQAPCCRRMKPKEYFCGKSLGGNVCL